MKLFCYVKTVLNGVGSIRIHWEGVKGQHYIESFSHTGCQKIIVLQGCHHRTPWFDILHFGRCWFKSGVISNLCAGRKVFFGQEPVPSTMHVPEENSAGVTNTMKHPPSNFSYEMGRTWATTQIASQDFFVQTGGVVPPILYLESFCS